MPNRTDSERLAAIETSLNNIEKRLFDNIEKRLFGNGQPGELEQLHERINAHGKRVSSLENWRWWLTGVAVGVGTLLGYILR